MDLLYPRRRRKDHSGTFSLMFLFLCFDFLGRIVSRPNTFSYFHAREMFVKDLLCRDERGKM